MKKLHVNLDDEAEAAWNSVLLHPNFRRTTQQGIIETLCSTYLRLNVGETTCNKAAAERVIEPDLIGDGSDDSETDPVNIPGTPEFNAALDALLS